jgi:pimeloyl-ACP methyl ester carboxylesterase
VCVGLNLRTFLDRVVGRPAIVAGHSSGGQLAAWLGANAPELVCGVLLEDPPMFTTLWPRCQRTWNWVDLASTCHFFLESGATDFVLWYVRYGQTWRLFGRLAAPLQRRAREDRVERPMSAVRLWLLPPVLNEMLRGMQRFDPRFGEQFYTGRWNDGFDHEATLAAIQQPSALIHANCRYDRDGILQGAMDDDDAEHARHLLGRAAFHRVRSGHNVHGSRPRHYLAVLDELASAVG